MSITTALVGGRTSLVPAPAAVDPDVRRGRSQVRLVCGLIAFGVVGQRLVLSFGGGELPLLLVAAVVAAGVGVHRGLLRIDGMRAGLMLLALGCCATTGVLALASGRRDTSLLSVLFLLLTYAPFLTVLDRPPAWVLDRCLRFTTRLALVAAVTAVVQVVLQPLGVAYSDLPASVIPGSLLASGFHTSYPIVYGSSIYKANAWIFLEPSFCSQFLGLALVILLARGGRAWQMLLLAAGIACTVAGTGMVMVALGALVLVLRKGFRALRVLLAPVLAVVAVIALTPVGSVLGSRLTETGQSGSSGNLRFVEPFQVLGGAWLSHLGTAVLGAGPGASERLAVQVAGSTALQQPAPLKLLYDYGAVAAVVFVVVLVWLALSRVAVAVAPVTVILLAAWLILNSSLLLPAVVVPLWLYTSLMADLPSRRQPASVRTGVGPRPVPAVAGAG